MSFVYLKNFYHYKRYLIYCRLPNCVLFITKHGKLVTNFMIKWNERFSPYKVKIKH